MEPPGVWELRWDLRPPRQLLDTTLSRQKTARLRDLRPPQRQYLCIRLNRTNAVRLKDLRLRPSSQLPTIPLKSQNVP